MSTSCGSASSYSAGIHRERCAFLSTPKRVRVPPGQQQANEKQARDKKPPCCALRARSPLARVPTALSSDTVALWGSLEKASCARMHEVSGGNTSTVQITCSRVEANHALTEARVHGMAG